MYFDSKDANKSEVKGNFKLLRNRALFYSLWTSNHKNKILKETLMSSLTKVCN